MDGRGRVMDNIFIERLWRSVKYEDIYLKDYVTVADLIEGLEGYFAFYDQRRKHQALEYRTPFEVFHPEPVESDGHSWEVTRYVHLNPVRAGIVSDSIFPRTATGPSDLLERQN
jgi:hypothetical protein